MNDEFLNPNDEIMTKAEARTPPASLFELRHSFVILISSFVISPPTFYHSPSLPAEFPHCLHSSDLRVSQCSRPSNPFGHWEFRKISKIIGAPELGSRARRSVGYTSRTEGWSPSALLVFGGGRPRMKKGALCWWTPHPHETQGPCQRSRTLFIIFGGNARPNSPAVWG